MAEETKSNEDSNTQIPDIAKIFDQLSAVDFTIAQLNLDLKDPDKRQEIGIRLVEALNDAFTQGMTFSDIKVKTKSGVANVSFKFPVASLVRGMKA